MFLLVAERPRRPGHRLLKALVPNTAISQEAVMEWEMDGDRIRLSRTANSEATMDPQDGTVEDNTIEHMWNEHCLCRICGKYITQASQECKSGGK